MADLDSPSGATQSARTTGGTRGREHQGREKPLVSILTVVFNDRDELAELIDNVSEFRNEDLELVVVDGGSTDGTVPFLQGSDDKVDYWISEPDKGIYDAMNKGLAACAGSYVLHLNAGDRLVEIPWGLLRQSRLDKIDVVSCRVMIDGNITFLPRTGLISKIDNSWHHQGTFYLSATHRQYDCSYRICGDFDHNQRLLKSGCRALIDPSVVSNHKSGGISMTAEARVEILRSVRENFGVFYLMLSRLRFAFTDLRRWRVRRAASSNENA